MRNIVTNQDFQKSVLAGILSDTSIHSVRRMYYCVQNLRQEHFSNHYLICWNIIVSYLQLTDHLISSEHFVSIVEQTKLEAEDRGAVLSLYAELRVSVAQTEGEFRFNVVRLRESTQHDYLVDALAETMDVLRTGKKIGTNFVVGYAAAREVLEQCLAKLANMSEEGVEFSTMHKDAPSVLREYADAKFNKTPQGLKYGFQEIDEATGGAQPGELILIPGYTSEGKSTLLYSILDNFVYYQGKNCVIGTAESKKNVVKRRMACIRSADPRYGFTDGPVDYERLKHGRLDSHEEKKLEHVIQDMQRDCYGRLGIFTLPDQAKVGHVFSILDSWNRQFKLDAYGWDYIYYSRSDNKHVQRRDDTTELIQSTKTRTLNFDNRRGLITISPFQTSRSKWEQACKDGYYTLACMEEVSQAEKAADVVMSILQVGGLTKMQLLKNRDGRRHTSPFEVDYDKVANKITEKPKARGLAA